MKTGGLLAAISLIAVLATSAVASEQVPFRGSLAAVQSGEDRRVLDRRGERDGKSCGAWPIYRDLSRGGRPQHRHRHRDVYLRRGQRRHSLLELHQQRDTDA